VAGSAAYSAHVELDETEDIDLVLSRPLEAGALVSTLRRAAHIYHQFPETTWLGNLNSLMSSCTG